MWAVERGRVLSPPIRPRPDFTASSTGDRLESKEAEGAHFYDERVELLRLLAGLNKCTQEFEE